MLENQNICKIFNIFLQNVLNNKIPLKHHIYNSILDIIIKFSNLRDVIIPFKIPWENSPALQTQEGMGAFGHTRAANIKIDQGSKPLVQVRFLK